MAKTERAQYIFAVKECSDGTPWIMLEPLNGNIEILNNGFLGFDLPEGTGIHRAEQIAEYMRNNLSKLTYTNLK